MNDLEHISIKGVGYFCHVKLYRNRHTGEEFAFKELKKTHYQKEEYRYRLTREINLLKDLNGCNNIISLLDYGNDKEKESLWYLMPFAQSNLFDYVRRQNNTLTLEERFDIIDQVIMAIKFAHERSILHRDISPNNVLVFFEGDKPVFKVADFGLGKDAESLSHYTASSSSGYGQILYVAPEQRVKLKDASAQSDIYSLGKLVYFIFTGRDPDNVKPFALSTLVTRAIEERPEDRFTNIQEFDQHYNSLKELHLNRSIAMEYVTLLEVAENLEIINIHYLNQLLVQGNVFGHVYSDYISPVIKIFANVSYLKEYYIVVGNGIADFVGTLSARLEECYHTTGWPFSAMNGFGKLLKNLILIVNEDNVKLICFKHLWKMAFEFDQWEIQRDIKLVFNETHIPATIVSQLAEYIIDQETETDMQHFQSQVLPKTIKIAIIKANEIVKAKKEAKKMATGVDEDFDF